MKEIRGLNLRILITVVVATVSIVSSVFLMKSSLEGHFRDLEESVNGVKADQQTSNKISEVNYKVFEMRLTNLENRVSELEKKHSK